MIEKGSMSSSSGGDEPFKCFVGGLPWCMDDQGLGDNFRRFGAVLDAKVMIHKDTRKSRGFGFVTFADQKGLDKAIEGLHQKELEGRIVTVNKAVPPVKERHDRDREREMDREQEQHKRETERERYQRDYGSGYLARGDIRSGGDTSCYRCGRHGHWARECRDRYVRPQFGGGSYGRRAPPPPPPPPPPLQDFHHPYERFDDGYGRDGRYDYHRVARASDRLVSGGPLRYESYRDRPGPYDRFSVAVTYDRPRVRGARSAYPRY